MYLSMTQQSGFDEPGISGPVVTRLTLRLHCTNGARKPPTKNTYTWRVILCGALGGKIKNRQNMRSRNTV